MSTLKALQMFLGMSPAFKLLEKGENVRLRDKNTCHVTRTLRTGKVWKPCNSRHLK